MVCAKQLMVASPCRRCGILIPPGTSLAAISWDGRERTWTHRSPPCEVVEQSARAGTTPGENPIELGSRLTPVPPPGRRSGSDLDSSEPLGFGSWSVTVEIHEAEDPAQSKRVFRIARLHLRTFEEAHEVSERLRDAL